MFKKLLIMTGREQKIAIANPCLLRAYNHDKYHVVLSDLYSLLQNETERKNDRSLFKSSIDYIAPLKNQMITLRKSQPLVISFPDHNIVPLSPDRKRSHTCFDFEIEKERLISAFKSLFPKISNDYEITHADISCLISQTKSLEKTIASARHSFGHKYDEQAIASHKAKFKKFKFDNVIRTLDKFTNFVKNIKFLFARESFADAPKFSTTKVQDQVDQIILGNVGQIHDKFYRIANPNDYHYLAREKFYKSEKLLEIIYKNPKVSS